MWVRKLRNFFDTLIPKIIHEKDVFSQEAQKKKPFVLPAGVEPTCMTFCLLFQMLYHWATGDLWELLKATKSQYPHTNSPNWSPYISLKNELREYDKRSEHFPSGDHFINSHNLISRQCMDIVRRKLMLVTIGTNIVHTIRTGLLLCLSPLRGDLFVS